MKLSFIHGMCFALLVLFSAHGADKTLAVVNDTEALKIPCSRAGTPVVLLNVWAINCSHCMDELTLLAKLARGPFKDSKELGFLGVCLFDASIADSDARMNGILEKKNVPYPTVVWKGEIEKLRSAIQLDATPYTALFDAKGNLLEVLELPRTEEKAVPVLRAALQAALKKIGSVESK